MDAFALFEDSDVKSYGSERLHVEVGMTPTETYKFLQMDKTRAVCRAVQSYLIGTDASGKKEYH